MYPCPRPGAWLMPPSANHSSPTTQPSFVATTVPSRVNRSSNEGAASGRRQQHGSLCGSTACREKMRDAACTRRMRAYVCSLLAACSSCRMTWHTFSCTTCVTDGFTQQADEERRVPTAEAVARQLVIHSTTGRSPMLEAGDGVTAAGATSGTAAPLLCAVEGSALQKSSTPSTTSSRAKSRVMTRLRNHHAASLQRVDAKRRASSAWL